MINGPFGDEDDQITLRIDNNPFILSDVISIVKTHHYTFDIAGPLRSYVYNKMRRLESPSFSKVIQTVATWENENLGKLHAYWVGLADYYLMKMQEGVN